MELLHEPPPGFDGIVKAFAMARLLPTTHRMDVKIGFAQDGVLFATGRLDGYRQVTLLADHVRSLGWREHLLGGEADMHGCDMLFSHPCGFAPREDDDPSFIRRAAVELWPSRSPHADC